MNLPARLSRRRHRSGFTLVELLVIVVILGILAVMLFANLKRAIWKAKEGRTFEHLQSLRTAVQVFYAQKGGEYTFTIDSNTAHATNGYPYSLTEHPTNAADVMPPAGGSGWSIGDGENNPAYIVEKGRYSENLNTYLSAIPVASITRNGDYQIAFDDGNIWANNGIWEVNLLSTDVNSSPGSGVSNMNYRGWHYRNTDGKVRINNTCTSTEGQQYDVY